MITIITRDLFDSFIKVQISKFFGWFLADSDLVVVKDDPASHLLVFHVAHIVPGVRGGAHMRDKTQQRIPNKIKD